MNSGEKEVNRMAQAAKMSDRRNWKKLNGKEFNIYTPIAVGVICVVWFFCCTHVRKQLPVPNTGIGTV